MALRRLTAGGLLVYLILALGVLAVSDVPRWPQGAFLLVAPMIFMAYVAMRLQRAATQASARLEQFQLLYFTMREGVALRQLILDAEGKPCDYRYLEVNPAYEKMSGFTRAEILGKTWRQLAGSEQAVWPREYDDYADVALNGLSRRFTRSYNGRYFEVHAYQPKYLQFAAVYTDITEQLAAERQMWDNYEDWARLVTTMGDMLFILDVSGRILHVNSSVETTLGYSASELMGKASLELHPQESLQEAEENIGEVLKGKSPERAVPLVAKDGTLVEVETRSVCGKWRGQEAVFAVVRDVRERLLAEKRLRYLSLHDQMTDVYNRAFFSAEMERLEGSREYPISIILADANGLKLINDVLGHRAGDEFLKASAAVLRSVLRKSDILARVGGDEFAVILPRTEAADAEAILLRIRAASASFTVEGGLLPMSLSIGVATSNHQGVSLDDTYKLADHLMYRDKLAERSRAHQNILGALLRVLAERDYGALGHTARLKEWCLRLGLSFELTARQLEALALLADIHDFGLVGVSADVLGSRARLTEEEYELIRQHPERGLRTAYTFPELAGVADLILAHHEHWDGNGYPLGIRGTDIPLECRILAVADAYEVMTGGRPYREPLPPPLAIAELKRGAGLQFAPAVVEEFCAVVANATFDHSLEHRVGGPAK